MIMLNTLDGSHKKRVRIKMAITADVVVGGTSDDDRVDSVNLMFLDHLYEIAKAPVEWFKDGMTSVSLDDVHVMQDGEKPDEGDWNWADYENETGERGYGN
jgi:hypothetical protein